MRLYLSSFRLGNQPQALVRLFGHGKRVAVIANATDFLTDEERIPKVKAEYDLLSSIGFKPEEIDLRNYFSKSDKLRAVLEPFDCIWVRGGNVFLLRRAFRQSGFDVILKELLETDQIAYGGYSAGVCILAATLRGLEFVDEPDTVASGYNKEVIWDGLSVLPYSVAPHYKSDHPESAAVDRCVAYFAEHSMPFRALRDGEAIIVDNDSRVVA
jgi:dipeptidase E